MSSEQEESADHVDDPNANSSSAETNQSPEKKDNVLNEHAKPRRRRRGKKRKHQRESAATCKVENHKQSGGESQKMRNRPVDGGNSMAWDSDENFSCDVDTFSGIIIRPLNAPKAPENSTQFLMDDHNDCHFYMSFETPNPYLVDPPHPDGEGDIIEPLEEDAAYRDIDYQYESPQDFDNSAYCDREFELSYKDNRFDELMRLSRTELTSALHELEFRLKDLKDEVVKENPSSILNNLQAELLELQEKNSYLKEYKSKLTPSVLPKNSTVKLSSDEVPPTTLPGYVSPIFIGFNHESSGSETYHDCNDFIEDVVMNEAPTSTCDAKPTNPDSTSVCFKLEQTQCNVNSSVNKSYEISSSEVKQSGLSLNSHILQHCQSTNMLLKDDIRTFSMNSNSDIFHAKCSSSVPIEGGMSPSETSVN